MSTQRHVATAAAFLALSLTGAIVHAPLTAQAPAPPQRGGAPNPDTPQLLVAVFHSTDKLLGVEAADEVRKRIQSEHNARELYATPKATITATLIASGYPPDSALSATDLMVLARQVHADYVLQGTVEKGGAGMRLDAQLLTSTANQMLSQPLPRVEGKDVGDMAKGAERRVAEAMKSMAAYKLCTNDLRAQKYDDAKRDARVGIVAYPASTLNRLCVLSAFGYAKAPPDSIIEMANEIVALDPTSILALSYAADAYVQKGDTNKAIEYNLRVYRADPSNTAVANSIVQQLANSGAPDKALPIIDSLLVQNPGDPNMLHTKWLLQLRANQFKNALISGEEYVKADTAAASVEYFNRQIGAAQKDSNQVAVQQLASRGAQKFPKELNFALLLATSYYKAGQLQQAVEWARRASAIDPKNPGAALITVVTFNQMNQPDSALAAAKQAIAGGVPKDSLSAAVSGLAGPALKKAQESNARADWLAALAIAQTVDSIAPSAETKYFIGVSAFKVGADAIGNVQTLAKGGKEDKAKACAENKVAEDMFATSSIAMPAGAQFDKATAGTIMGALQQYGAYVTQVKTALKCK